MALAAITEESMMKKVTAVQNIEITTTPGPNGQIHFGVLRLSDFTVEIPKMAKTIAFKSQIVFYSRGAIQ